MSRKFWYVLAGITLIGALFRFAFLGSNPIALNRDEASIGYNAYSILQTGHDEFGRFWPINVESFGDWKLPGYIYATAISIHFFGLHEWSIRLPAALAGTLLIPATAALALQLWPHTKKYRWFAHPALWAATIIVVSPWTIRLSRQTYESMLGLTFVTTAITLILHGLRFPRRQKWSFPLAAVLLGISLLTYHAYQAFVPLLVLGLLIIYWKKIWSQFRHSPLPIILSILIGIGLIGLLFWGGAQTANQTKLQGLSIFDERIYYDQLFQRRTRFADPTSVPAKLSANIPLLTVEKVGRNIASIFSADFLFLNGGHHGSHDVAGMGNISPLVFFFAVIGLGRAIQQRHQKNSQTVLLLIFISFAAPIITVQAAHSVRLLPLMIGLSLVASWGLAWLLQITRKTPLVRFALGLATVAFLLQICMATKTYFVTAPQRDTDTWNWVTTTSAIQDVTALSQKHSVFVPYLRQSYAIYFLFYNQTDPQTLPDTVGYEPVDEEGFHYLNQVGNISFRPMDWDTFSTQPETQYILIQKSQIPADKVNLPIEKEYTYPGASQNYYLLRNH